MWDQFQRDFWEGPEKEIWIPNVAQNLGGRIKWNYGIYFKVQADPGSLKSEMRFLDTSEIRLELGWALSQISETHGIPSGFEATTAIRSVRPASICLNTAD
jgi:hypothetical protein